MDLLSELSKFENNTKEYKFFKSVFEKLGTDFIPKSLSEKQREVHCKLNEAKQEYFQKYILTNAIMKSAEEYKYQEDSTQALSYAQSLNLNEAKRCLSIDRYQKLKLFGLSQDQISKEFENHKSQSQNAVFKKLVEDNINDFCKKLIVYTGGLILPGEDWTNAFDRTIKDLECKVIAVRSQETRERLRKGQLREMIKTFNEELSKGLSLIRKALSLTEQQLQFEADLSECYHIRCQAVSLKLKCCELEILQLTYNQETMPALKKISAHLDHSEQKLPVECYEKTFTLESYLKLGEDYEHLVDEYADLIKTIKEQQWAIDELKSGESQYGASSSN